VRWAWLAAVLAALVVTAGTGVALYLVHAPAVEIVKTAGVAGGAVVALYALWLNDRRRKVEEARHSLESEKVADERFARSVEMLGNEADQVRVGAMHAMAWLANSTPRYKQTVIDVLCAYLRRPYSHPAHGERSSDPDQAFVDDVPTDADQERQVRLTAQRLITDLLPWGQDPDETVYHLDLTGATLEYFRLEGRRFGRLIARRAQFYGITHFRRLRSTKPVLFSGATFHGRVDLAEAKFLGGLAFSDTRFSRRKVDFRDAEVGTFLALSEVPPALQVGELKLLPRTALRTQHAGWALTGDVQPARPRLQDEIEEDAGGGADGVRSDGDGLGNGKVAAKADEARAVRLDDEGLRDQRDPEADRHEVEQ
jgi:hypothetical protein